MLPDGDDSGRQKLLRNERTKLLAAALTNGGIAIIVTGVVAPAVAYLYGSGHIVAGRPWLVGLTFFAAGAALLAGGQVALRRLR